MKRLSRLGLILASLYVLFTLFCVVRTEFCFRKDGLVCAIGYFLPGMPWSLSLDLIPDRLFRSLGAKLGEAVSLGIPTISTLLNLYLAYWYGRVMEEGRRNPRHGNRMGSLI